MLSCIFHLSISGSVYDVGVCCNLFPGVFLQVVYCCIFPDLQFKTEENISVNLTKLFMLNSIASNHFYMRKSNP